MDRRYMAPKLIEPETRKKLDDQERRTATFLLPIGIAVGLMAVIAWVFIAIATPSSKMQTSEVGSSEQPASRPN